MRENTRLAWYAWKNCRNYKSGTGSVRTGGHPFPIYSYGTVLLIPYKERAVALNVTKYSVTTTMQQNGLRVLAERDGYRVVEVDGLFYGATASEVALAAKERRAEGGSTGLAGLFRAF